MAQSPEHEIELMQVDTGLLIAELARRGRQALPPGVIMAEKETLDCDLLMQLGRCTELFAELGPEYIQQGQRLSRATSRISDLEMEIARLTHELIGDELAEFERGEP